MRGAVSMDIWDLPKLDDVDLIEHVHARHAYLEADRPKICPCCGGRAQGLDLPHCTDPGWSHSETCALYRYADDVCAPCAGDLARNHR